MIASWSSHRFSPDHRAHDGGKHLTQSNTCTGYGVHLLSSHDDPTFIHTRIKIVVRRKTRAFGQFNIAFSVWM
ncbi:MAG: hypothetical protein ACI8SI_002829 [Congregibacter sp.]|jgi:hypothetical protein